MLPMPPEPRVHVAFCLRNIDRPTCERLKAFAQQNPEVELEPAGCLCHCSRCVDVPFLLVNGRIVEGATHLDILEDLRVGARP